MIWQIKNLDKLKNISKILCTILSLNVISCPHENNIYVAFPCLLCDHWLIQKEIDSTTLKYS